MARTGLAGGLLQQGAPIRAEKMQAFGSRTNCDIFANRRQRVVRDAGNEPVPVHIQMHVARASQSLNENNFALKSIVGQSR